MRAANKPTAPNLFVDYEQVWFFAPKMAVAVDLVDKIN